MNPSSPTLGRGLLLFAALMAGLGVFLAVQRAWRDASLWLCVSIFMACYGTITLNWWPSQQRLLVGIGMVAGAIAFALALWASVLAS